MGEWLRRLYFVDDCFSAVGVSCSCPGGMSAWTESDVIDDEKRRRLKSCSDRSICFSALVSFLLCSPLIMPCIFV